MSKVRVAVVMGGPSAEREVSIESGQAVMRALASLGHDAQSLDFDGRFVDALREIRPDVVFNALHGTGGEDGTIQGVLEWLGIPYTGSDLTSCALAMDKHITKKLLAAEGLPTPAWDTFDLAGGTLPLRFHEMARDASVSVPYAGTLPELYEVLELAKAGLIKPEVETVSFEGVLDTYRRLEHGELRGRAVLVPGA